MNIYKSTTFLWWQLGLLKLSLLALGIVIGAYWPQVFKRWLWFILVVFLVPGIYITYVWATQ